MLQRYHERIENANMEKARARQEFIGSIRYSLTELMEAGYKGKFHLGVDPERENVWWSFIGASNGFYFKDGGVYDSVVVKLFLPFLGIYSKAEKRKITLDDIPLERYSDSTLSNIVQEIESAQKSLVSSNEQSPYHVI